MTNEYSRFQKKASVPVHPGHCLLCKGIKGPFIDTGVTIPWEGAVFICSDCLIEAHRQLGLPEPEPVIKEVFVDNEKTLHNVLTSIREIVNERLNVANTPAADDPILGDGSVVFDLPDAKVDGKAEGNVAEPKPDDGEDILGAVASDAGGDDSVKSSNKSNRKSGRSDVPSVTSDDEPVSLITF